MMHSPFSFRNFSRGIQWLLIANTVLFALQNIFGRNIELRLGLIPTEVWGSFEIWRLFTTLFLHGSFFHFLFNMFALWMFGKELESIWGTKEFLKYYFFCGVGAGLFNVALEPFSTQLVIGSSGAIYGLLIAFALLFPETVIYLYAIIPMRAKHFLILVGGIEFLASFEGSTSAIARFAHLSGMAAGYFYLKSYTFRSVLNRAIHKILDSIVAKKPSVKRRKEASAEHLAAQVDKILEKILIHGADCLTDKERDVMRRYSSKKN